MGGSVICPCWAAGMDSPGSTHPRALRLLQKFCVLSPQLHHPTSSDTTSLQLRWFSYLKHGSNPLSLLSQCLMLRRLLTSYYGNLMTSHVSLARFPATPMTRRPFLLLAPHRCGAPGPRKTVALLASSHQRTNSPCKRTASDLQLLPQRRSFGLPYTPLCALPKVKSPGGRPNATHAK